MFALAALMLSSALPASADATTGADGKVSVKFFGEGLWPECQSFATTQLNALLQFDPSDATAAKAKAMATIVDFTFVPWGNAYINTSECGLPAAPGWEKTGYNGDAKLCWMKQCAADESKCVASPTEPMICQHGPNECLVDSYEGCAMLLNPSWLEYMPFVQCFEGHAASRAVVGIDTDPAAVHLAAQLCALVNSPAISWSALHACAAAGDADKANAIATVALNPPHLFTPWVTLNGVPQDPYPHFPGDDDDPDHYNPLDHLLASVCGNYTGTAPLPAACSSPTP